MDVEIGLEAGKWRPPTPLSGAQKQKKVVCCAPRKICGTAHLEGVHQINWNSDILHVTFKLFARSTGILTFYMSPSRLGIMLGPPVPRVLQLMLGHQNVPAMSFKTRKLQDIIIAVVPNQYEDQGF